LLGLSGNVTNDWAVSANYSYLDSEVLQGASDFSAGLGEDYIKGDPLTQVPKHAFTLWTTYDFAFGLQVGYGATYQSELYVSQHSATNIDGPLAKSAAYWVQRAMASYRISKGFDVQLNVNNIFDKEYYQRIRNNGWATPGEGRSAILSANFSF
jgi:catecholate siderophore receptor